MTDSIDDLLKQIPMDQLASRLGVDENEAEQLTRQAVPALVGGMKANAQDPRGAASLAEALGQHSGTYFDEGVDLDKVDTEDGDKIVGHVFGENREQVVNRLGGGGGTGNTLAKLLPLLAPLVIGWLAKSAKSSGGQQAGAAPDAGGLDDLLGGLLGGGGEGGLGDLLGGLLGGGRKA